MRTIIQVELDTPTANKLIADGDMAKRLDGLIADLRPEAAYFYARHGRRACTLVVDAPDEASLVRLCEPFWIELNASVETFTCMNADDVHTGLARLG